MSLPARIKEHLTKNCPHCNAASTIHELRRELERMNANLHMMGCALLTQERGVRLIVECHVNHDQAKLKALLDQLATSIYQRDHARAKAGGVH